MLGFSKGKSIGYYDYSVCGTALEHVDGAKRVGLILDSQFTLVKR